MKFDRQSRHFFASFAFLTGLLGPLMSSLSFGGEGGSHTNGDDTRRMPTKNWIGPGGIDPNTLFSEDPNLVVKAVDLFHQVHPEVKIAGCIINGQVDLSTRYPIATDAMKMGVRFLVPKGQICNDRSLLNAYREAFVLYHWLNETDEIGSYLIHSIFKLSNHPIQFIIEKQSRKTNGTTESAWYDPSDASIHWSAFRNCEGMDCLLGRRSYHILRHELMHVLTHRALKDRYPKVDHDHDPKHPATTEYLFDNDWLKNSTSVGAAYLEGLANVVERENSHWTDHPYIKKYGDFGHFYEDGRYPSYGEAISKNSFLGIDYGGEITARLDNEVYVSSTLQALTDAYEVGPEVLKGRLDSDLGTAYSTTSLPRIRDIIDAVTLWAPVNVRGFAKALNAVTRSNLGNRWYFEFYFEDLVTGKNLSSFATVQSKGGIGGKYQEYCLRNKSDLKKLFSPTLWQQKLATEKLARETLFDHVKAAELNQEIKERIFGMEGSYRNLLPDWKVLIQGYGSMEHSLGQTSLCKTKKNWCEYPENSPQLLAAYAINSKLKKTGVLCDFSEDLAALACGGFPAKQKSYEDRFASLRQRWSALQTAHPAPKTAAYHSKIEQFFELKAETERLMHFWWSFSRNGATVIQNPELVKSIK